MKPTSERLDVVARLADHQRNLAPPPAPGGALLLALPAPPLARVIEPAHCAAARELAIDEACGILGGGDGPLPRCDLDVDVRSLPAILRELEASGVATLYLHGAVEQPGFARAVIARWPGSVVRVEDRLPQPATSGASAASDAAPPDARLGPWSGFLPFHALFGTARGERTRQAWSSSWRERGDEDAVRAAALGLDPALEARLSEASRDDPAARRASVPVVAIAGLDGAGKSSHALALSDALASAGVAAPVLRLYRHGAFLELADELGARTVRGAPLAAFRTSRLVKLVDSLRVLRDDVASIGMRSDLLIFDRYVETHVAAARSQLGWDLAGHPFLAAFPTPDRAFWLELPAESALARLHRRDARASADEHPTGLRGYAAEFERLASRSGGIRLRALDPFETNAARIADAVRDGLALHRSDRPRAEVDEARPAAARRSCRLHVGVRRGFELGHELFELRRLLIERLGEGAAAVPEATWLEAYCAQLVLDLRIERPEEAFVALWPAALARMRSCRDLLMLDELARLLAPEATVASWSLDRELAAAAFAALGAGPAGARRLAADYVAALGLLLAEQGVG